MWDVGRSRKKSISLIFRFLQSCLKHTESVLKVTSIICVNIEIENFSKEQHKIRHFAPSSQSHQNLPPINMNFKDYSLVDWHHPPPSLLEHNTLTFHPTDSIRHVNKWLLSSNVKYLWALIQTPRGECFWVFSTLLHPPQQHHKIVKLYDDGTDGGGCYRELLK